MNIVNELLTNKPFSIFDHIDKKYFNLDINNIDHQGYLLSGNYYEIYYAISKYYTPKSILEIGVRYGYSLLSMISGSLILENVVGYDIECYVKNSNSVALKNINEYCFENKKNINVKIENIDTQKLTELNSIYDLIHIDGNHSLLGKKHDLNLIKNKCKICIIDDFKLGHIKSAGIEFININKDIIQNYFLIDSYRGTCIIEFKI